MSIFYPRKHPKFIISSFWAGVLINFLLTKQKGEKMPTQMVFLVLIFLILVLFTSIRYKKFTFRGFFLSVLMGVGVYFFLFIFSTSTPPTGFFIWVVSILTAFISGIIYGLFSEQFLYR